MVVSLLVMERMILSLPYYICSTDVVGYSGMLLNDKIEYFNRERVFNLYIMDDMI